MLIAMSDNEIDRLKVIQDVCERRLRRTDATELLNLSVRLVQRLMNRLRQYGVAGLSHKLRGKPSNNKLPRAINPVLTNPELFKSSNTKE